MVRLSEETGQIVLRRRVGDGEKVEAVEQARSGGDVFVFFGIVWRASDVCFFSLGLRDPLLWFYLFYFYPLMYFIVGIGGPLERCEGDREWRPEAVH